MGYMLDQIEALTDSQRLLENYYSYSDKYLRKVGEKIPGGKWRVVLKWSTKVSNACMEDEEAVLSKMRDVEKKA